MSQFEEQEISEGKDYVFSVFINLEMDELRADLSYQTNLTADNQEQAREKFLESFNSRSLDYLIDKADGVKFLPSPSFGPDAAAEQMRKINSKLGSGYDLSLASIVGFEAEGEDEDGEEVLIDGFQIG